MEHVQTAQILKGKTLQTLGNAFQISVQEEKNFCRAGNVKHVQITREYLLMESNVKHSHVHPDKDL